MNTELDHFYKELLIYAKIVKSGIVIYSSLDGLI